MRSHVAYVMLSHDTLCNAVLLCDGVLSSVIIYYN